METPFPKERMSKIEESRVAAELRAAILNGDREAETEARHRLLVGNAAIAPWFVLKQYRDKSFDLDELVAAAALGMAEGALRFDPQRDVRFGTYILFWVRLGITRYIRNCALPIRVPSPTWDLKSQVDRAIVDPANLPELDRITLEFARKAMTMQVEAVDERTRVIDEEPELFGFEIEERLGAIRDAVAEMAEPARSVVIARYLGDDTPPTYKALGAKLGVSYEHVRQIEKRAIESLRVKLNPMSVAV
jgi:RNA polymerase sigma factor (sigma-70 family)